MTSKHLFPLILLLAASCALAQTPAGHVISLEGDVTAFDLAGHERKLALRSQIYVGDQIITGTGARVQLFLLDETTISQGENSMMVIDEYVYTDEPEESNGMLRFMRGIFRSVTGRITEINPSRFRVTTGKAVIGVRGCDILFDIQPHAERIYVLELPPGRSILIEADYLPAGASPGREVRRSLHMQRSGRAVHLLDTGLIEETPIPPSDVRRLIRQTAPAGSEPPPPSRPGRGRSPADSPDLAEDPGDDPDAPVPLRDTADARFLVDLDDDLIPRPTLSAPDPKPEPSPPKPGPEPGPDPKPIPPRPRQLAAGQDWEWGIWESSSGELLFPYVEGNYLPASTVESIITGSGTYNLAGSGRAGALVIQAGKEKRLLQGTADLSVSIGGDQVPVWAGTYALNGDRSTLDFQAAGTIQRNNTMGGQAYSYRLMLDGTVHPIDSLTQNRVNGRLVGKPEASFPVTGAAGEFIFSHGPGRPHVDGVFGADLTSSP